MGGTIDGRRGDHLLLAPPFIVTASTSTRSCRASRPPSTEPLRRCPDSGTRSSSSPLPRTRVASRKQRAEARRPAAHPQVGSLSTEEEVDHAQQFQTQEIHC